MYIAISEIEKLFPFLTPLAVIAKQNMVLIGSLAHIIETFISAYQFILEFRVLLYWFPIFNPYLFPFTVVTFLTDPFMLAWDRVVPSFLEIDLSVYVGFLFLESTREVMYQLQQNIFFSTTNFNF